MKIDHIGLTVRDVKTTADFFMSYFNFEIIGEKPDYPAIFIANEHCKLTLWQIFNDFQSNKFNRQQQMGLHHLAFKYGTIVELIDFSEKLKMTTDIVIEFMPSERKDKFSQHMMMIWQESIRIELIGIG